MSSGRSLSMPNRSDKNWVRLCIALECFFAKYGRWPTRLRANPRVLEDLTHLLSQEGSTVLKKRLQVVADASVGVAVADDRDGYRLRSRRTRRPAPPRLEC